MKPVLFLAHQASAGPGVLGDELKDAGIPFSVAPTWEMPRTPSLDDVSALVVLGGEQNADDTARHPYLAANRVLVAGAVARGLPVLGICLGAQILARALGGRVARGTAREIGWKAITASPAGQLDPVVGPLAAVDRLFQWHEDCFELPPGCVPLAHNEVGPQAFRFGESAYGLQFHVEVTTATIEAWVQESGIVALREQWRSTPEELMSGAARHLPAQAKAARTALHAFLRLAGRPLASQGGSAWPR